MNMRKRFSADFKAKLVLEVLKEEKTLSELSSEYGVHVSQLVRWKNAAIEGLPGVFADPRKKVEEEKEKQIEELYREIGRLTTQMSWLKKKCGLRAEQG
jgi:transposase-like protein